MTFQNKHCALDYPDDPTRFGFRLPVRIPCLRTIPDAMFTAFRCFTGECTTYAGEPIHYLLALEFGYPFMFLYVGCYMLVTMGIFNVILAVYVPREPAAIWVSVLSNLPRVSPL